MNTIGVSGFGRTGSGAVLDLLREYEENQVFEKMEFNLAYLPDGLQDLEYHLVKGCSRFFSGDIALKRFNTLVDRIVDKGIRSVWNKYTNNKFEEFSKQLIKELSALQYRGMWSYDLLASGKLEFFLKFRIFERFFGWNHPMHKHIERDMYLSVLPENFYESCKKYVHSLLSEMGANFEQNLILNQSVPANNPSLSFPFFENPKAIIVDRDPRDVYLMMTQLIYSRYVPVKPVEDFITYFKVNRATVKEEANVLHVRFEDLVYKYEETLAVIEDFCGIKNHIKPCEYFNPEIALSNTQLFGKYKGYEEEIKAIEKALPEYLYDFEKYPPITSYGETF